MIVNPHNPWESMGGTSPPSGQPLNFQNRYDVTKSCLLKPLDLVNLTHFKDPRKLRFYRDHRPLVDTHYILKYFKTAMISQELVYMTISI